MCSHKGAKASSAVTAPTKAGGRWQHGIDQSAKAWQGHPTSRSSSKQLPSCTAPQMPATTPLHIHSQQQPQQQLLSLQDCFHSSLKPAAGRGLQHSTAAVCTAAAGALTMSLDMQPDPAYQAQPGTGCQAQPDTTNSPGMQLQCSGVQKRCSTSTSRQEPSTPNVQCADLHAHDSPRDTQSSCSHSGLNPSAAVGTGSCACSGKTPNKMDAATGMTPSMRQGGGPVNICSNLQQPTTAQHAAQRLLAQQQQQQHLGFLSIPSQPGMLAVSSSGQHVLLQQPGSQQQSYLLQCSSGLARMALAYTGSLQAQPGTAYQAQPGTAYQAQPGSAHEVAVLQPQRQPQQQQQQLLLPYQAQGAQQPAQLMLLSLARGGYLVGTVGLAGAAPAQSALQFSDVFSPLVCTNARQEFEQQVLDAYACGFADGAQAFKHLPRRKRQQQQQQPGGVEALAVKRRKVSKGSQERSRADCVQGATLQQQQQQQAEMQVMSITTALTGGIAAAAAVDVKAAALQLQQLTDKQLLCLAAAVVSTPVERLIGGALLEQEQQQQQQQEEDREIMLAAPGSSQISKPGRCEVSKPTNLAAAAATAAAAAVPGDLRQPGGDVAVMMAGKQEELLESVPWSEEQQQWAGFVGQQSLPMLSDCEYNMLELSGWLDA